MTTASLPPAARVLSLPAGGTLAATYLNDKALPNVRPVTDSLGCKLMQSCDVRVPGQLEAAFERIRAEWGQLDFLLHAIAYAPADDLHGRVVDCSAAGPLNWVPKQIRANAISPGPIRTRAASGIAHFDELLAVEAAAAPEHQLVDIEDVGALALSWSATARAGSPALLWDGGQHVIA